MEDQNLHMLQSLLQKYGKGESALLYDGAVAALGRSASCDDEEETSKLDAEIITCENFFNSM